MGVSQIQSYSGLVNENGVPYGVRHLGNKPRVVSTPYFMEIAKGNVPNHFAVNKFGQNLAVSATIEDIWDGSENYEYLVDDTFALMYISSDNAADQSMTYEVTGIDSDYNYSTVEVTLDGADGRTFVVLTSGATDDKWWRIFRVLNTSATPALGNIYVSKDNTDVGGNGIPDDIADIQAKILIGNEQTLMCLWTCPIGYDAFLTNYYASTSSNKITSVNLFVRPFGGVFNIKAVFSINQIHMSYHYTFPISITEKSDVVIRASAAGGGGVVSSGFDLFYE